MRPGLTKVKELTPAVPTVYSPFGVVLNGAPGDLAAVGKGRAGMQDGDSQLVCLALTRVETPNGSWLDLCTGPSGESTPLVGLIRQRGEHLVANGVTAHRAKLAEQALAAYPPGTTSVVCSDGRGPEPVRRRAPFARIMMGTPCGGLGTLRRRPEARWRRTPTDLAEPVSLRRTLLEAAVGLLAPGGVVAYVTCSSRTDEAAVIVGAALGNNPHMKLLDAAALLPGVSGAARGGYVQLWPRRHRTDAMFLALLRDTS